MANAVEKPPLGIMPGWLWKEKSLTERIESLRAAIERFMAAGKEVPDEWFEELGAHLKALRENEAQRKDISCHHE